MTKIYQPKHFDPREFVSPEVYHELGDRALLLLDNRVLETADAIREYFGRPVTVNNWHLGGERVASGFRETTCPVGARYSQHRFGRALDLLVDKMRAEVVREAIIREQHLFKHVTTMEDGVAWVHFDCRAITNGVIYLFKA
jgi:hypothetical protein